MLKVSQFRELHEFSQGSSIDKMIHVVSVILDVDPNEIADYKPKNIVSEYARLLPITKISDRYSEQITIDENQLHLLPFEQIKLGQFIDLEELINQSEIINMHKVAATLYLQKQGGQMIEETFESYANINVEYRSNLINELPVNLIFGAVQKYMTFRQKFFSSYEIFNDPFEGVDVALMDEEEREIYNQEVKQRESQSQNQWLMLLNSVTDNDITKFNTVLDMNLFLVFNQISYLKSNKT